MDVVRRLPRHDEEQPDRTDSALPLDMDGEWAALLSIAAAGSYD